MYHFEVYNVYLRIKKQIRLNNVPLRIYQILTMILSAETPSSQVLLLFVEDFPFSFEIPTKMEISNCCIHWNPTNHKNWSWLFKRWCYCFCYLWAAILVPRMTHKYGISILGSKSWVATVISLIIAGIKDQADKNLGEINLPINLPSPFRFFTLLLVHCYF